MNSAFPRLSCIAYVCVAVSSSLADPVANPDDYDVTEDSLIVRGPVRGVLENDFPDPGDSLEAVLKTDVSNGRLDFSSNGGFSYVPNPGFSGTDSFTYAARGTPGSQTFIVDQSQSRVNFAATVSTNFGNASDNDNPTDLTGTIEVDLDPSEEPFSQIHITDLNVRNVDALSIRLRWFLGIAGVDADAAANGFTITMDQPGQPAAVDGAGMFNQTGNSLRIVGTADIDATGLADGLIPEGPTDVDTVTTDVNFPGTITQAGSTLTLNIPLNFTGDFDLDGNTLTLAISGTIVATSQVVSAGPESAPTTVTFDVSHDNDGPVPRVDQYFVNQNQTLTVPANAPGGTDTFIAAGAMWRYLDDGSDQGTAWRDWGFDDSTWSEGAAELGYGDDDESQVIEYGDDDNNRFITSYFRHAFNVTDPTDTSTLVLRLLRDDGAAVFLNGSEVVRDNLPVGAAFDTLADETTGNNDETTFFEFDIDPALLYSGQNVIAVEVHQAAADSSDVSFDLELIRTRSPGGVLANDEDADGGSVTASESSPPGDGSVTVNADGSFTYTPTPDFTGTDTFVYGINENPPALTELVLPFDAVWHYLDDGSNQGTAWRTTTFDDSSWPTGRGEFGYGDGDEVTTVSFGPDPNAKRVTTYFRTTFHIADPQTAIDNDLFMRLRRDDAAAIYLNGAEVYRDTNLAPAALFSDLAAGNVSDETAYVPISIPFAPLVAGENHLAVEVHQATASSSDLSFNLGITMDSVPPVPLIPRGSDWRYLDDGSDQGTAWQAPAFDDSAWAEGPAKFGYGEGDEATMVSFGGDANNKRITTYFRHRFHVADKSAVQSLLVRMVRDDGVAIHLNGTEVLAHNLATPAAFDQTASGAVSGLDEYAPVTATIDPLALVDGDNVLAVEVHQASAGSSDLGFDLELIGLQTSSQQTVRVTVIDNDTDDDMMSDDYERAFGLIVGVDDSGNDEDGDNRTNLEESAAFTDPFDSASVLTATAVAESGANVQITFDAVPGKTYTLEESTDLSTWTATGQTLTASQAMEAFTVVAPPGGITYWRVTTSG